MRRRILIGTTVVRIRILLGTTVVRIASASFYPSHNWHQTVTSAYKADPDKTYPFFFCFFFFSWSKQRISLSVQKCQITSLTVVKFIYHRFSSPFCQLKRKWAADFIDSLVSCHVFTRLRAHAQQLQWVAKTTSLSTLISPLPDLRAFSYSAVT